MTLPSSVSGQNSVALTDCTPRTFAIVRACVHPRYTSDVSRYFLSFVFTKADHKWTVKCKQKSRAQNTRQIPRAVLYSLPTGASDGYLHAGLDSGSISADSSRWHP